VARLSRKLRVCKWAGTVGCALIVFAFVASAFWLVGLQWQTQRYRYYGLWTYLGCLYVFRHSPSGDLHGLSWLPVWKLPPDEGGYTLTDFGWLPRIADNTPSITGLFLPLWIPFIVLLIPTLLLWWRDRWKPRPGFCRQCDYDLTGNVSGRCPECGLEIAKPAGDLFSPLQKKEADSTGIYRNQDTASN
jgi:hypothetical protein